MNKIFQAKVLDVSPYLLVLFPFKNKNKTNKYKNMISISNLLKSDYWCSIPNSCNLSSSSVCSGSTLLVDDKKLYSDYLSLECSDLSVLKEIYKVYKALGKSYLKICSENALFYFPHANEFEVYGTIKKLQEPKKRAIYILNIPGKQSNDFLRNILFDGSFRSFCLLNKVILNRLDVKCICKSARSNLSHIETYVSLKEKVQNFVSKTKRIVWRKIS
jgi:hypothetical protein